VRVARVENHSARGLDEALAMFARLQATRGAGVDGGEFVLQSGARAGLGSGGGEERRSIGTGCAQGCLTRDQILSPITPAAEAPHARLNVLQAPGCGSYVILDNRRGRAFTAP
jgi:hypothetical protein